jgi:hypothetical protein
MVRQMHAIRNRAPKFQSYFQSGFPHEHDQWLSATASAWATMVLTFKVDRLPSPVAQPR